MIMNIVKELNLNKNPNVVPNGSLVFAKNIKVSPDNSYITNEEGLTYAFSTPVSGTIVGIIPCMKEIVILSYLEADTGEHSSHIYRCVENEVTGLLDLTEVYSAWSYSGGKIVGTYTYNVKPVETRPTNVPSDFVGPVLPSKFGVANGTANISGTALAGGNWGTAPGGKTLTGELG